MLNKLLARDLFDTILEINCDRYIFHGARRHRAPAHTHTMDSIG